jgi:SH3-like domain-containing protein
MPSRFLSLLAALAVAALSGALPAVACADPIAPDSEHCVINVRSDDVLNLREAPSSRASILTGLRYGQCGVIVTGECRGDWCPVEDGHHAGWAHRHYLGMVSPARFCVIGVARHDVLNLRAWPSPQSGILTEIPPAACGLAALPYARDGWQKVRWEGWEGWVNGRYITDH